MQEHQWLITSFNPNIKSTSWDSFLKELELCVCHLQLKIFSLRCHCATLPRAGRTWQVPEAGSAVWPELQASWGTHRSVWDYQILCWHFFKREAKSIFSITAVIFSFSFCFSSSSHPHSTFWMVRGGVTGRTTLDQLKAPVHERPSSGYSRTSCLLRARTPTPELPAIWEASTGLTSLGV